MKIDKTVLEKLYIDEKKKQREIAKILKVKMYEVQNALVKYEITRKKYKEIGIHKNAFKHWTKEQDEYLIKNFGVIGYAEIGNSKLIQKKGSAVKARAHKLGLGDPLLNDECVTKTFLAKALKTDAKTVDGWIKKHNLESTIKIVSLKRVITSIKLKDFWEWAEKNQNLIVWRKFTSGELGAEPKWTNKAREDYRKNIPRNNSKQWTNAEDTLLQSYYKMGKKYKEIAELMGRKENGVSRRLLVISVARNKKAWSEEDKAKLGNLIKKGFTTKQISKKLDRSIKSVEMGRTRFINKPKQALKL